MNLISTKLDVSFKIGAIWWRLEIFFHLGSSCFANRAQIWFECCLSRAILQIKWYVTPRSVIIMIYKEKWILGCQGDVWPQYQMRPLGEFKSNTIKPRSKQYFWFLSSPVWLLTHNLKKKKRSRVFISGFWGKTHYITFGLVPFPSLLVFFSKRCSLQQSSLMCNFKKKKGKKTRMGWKARLMVHVRISGGDATSEELEWKDWSHGRIKDKEEEGWTRGQRQNKKTSWGMGREEDSRDREQEGRKGKSEFHWIY